MNLFSYLKTKVSILDVVSEYATLKKAGLYWKGQCPLHSEKTASFTVSPHKEIFYCFGCHAGGDVIAFISQTERCTPLEAANFLIERYQIDVPSTLTMSPTNKQEKKQYHELCKVISAWCHSQLLKAKEPMQYLLARNINQESVARFELGYFPGGLLNMKLFITEMARQNILVDDLVSIYFISKGKQIYFSPFEERIIFPITDAVGQVCGFGGRTFKNQDTRPKYYNSHENDYFAKGSLLFGLDRGKKEIQKTEKVFLVEGYTDTIMMAQHGYTNTVATLGTACTLEHLSLLSRYAQQLLVLYDGDAAGQQAILRMAELCWQANLDLYVISLPTTEDPASFLAKGSTLATLVTQAKDIFAFFIDTLGEKFSQKSLHEKLTLTRKIIELIQKIEDPLKQDLLLQNASKSLEIPFDSLKRELQHKKPGTFTPEQSHTPPPATPPLAGPLAALEKKIFCSIMNNIQLMTKENADFLITYLPTPLCDILSQLKIEKERVPDLGFIRFFELLTAHNQRLVSGIILEVQEEGRPDFFEQLLAQFQKKHWKVIINNIKIKLEAAKKTGDETEMNKIMHDFITLKKKILSGKYT